jgi:hypothetical protein
MKKRIYRFLAMFLQVGFLLGCAKPDHITTLKSPSSEFFYTVETYEGHGPLSSDLTRVYAHLERNGKDDKQLVLDGDYLADTRAIWLGPNEATLCISGFTHTFRNRVTLHVDDSTSNTIRTHLQENGCGTEDRTASPK